MLKGIVYIVMASVAYGILPAFSKTLLASGMNSQSVLFFRFLFAAVGALAIAKVSKTSLKVTRKQLYQLAFFSVAGYGATSFLLTTSYQYLPIGLATMFHFSYPLLVTIIMCVLYRERITGWKILAVCSAVLGIVMISELSGELNTTGMIFALCSGLTYAVYVVASRKSSFKDLPSLTVVLYTTTFLTVLFLLQGLITNSIAAPPTASAWFLALAEGWICSLFALLMLNKAVKSIGATYAAIGNMLEPITSLVVGTLLFGDVLGIRAYIGCVLVLFAVLLIAVDGCGITVFKKKKNQHKGGKL